MIGFVLLAVLLFIYLFVSTKNSRELQLIQKQQQDSVARVARIKDSVARAADTMAVTASMQYCTPTAISAYTLTLPALVATLSVLAAHFGLVVAPRAA